MATEQDVLALVTRLDAATNAVAATLQSLRDQIADGGLTKEQEAAAVASLDGAIARLEALGANPENPVPEPA
jgi:hypothetical protein